MECNFRSWSRWTRLESSIWINSWLSLISFRNITEPPFGETMFLKDSSISFFSQSNVCLFLASFWNKTPNMSTVTELASTRSWLGDSEVLSESMLGSGRYFLWFLSRFPFSCFSSSFSGFFIFSRKSQFFIFCSFNFFSIFRMINFWSEPSFYTPVFITVNVIWSNSKTSQELLESSSNFF